jgi:hypothetical protein
MKNKSVYLISSAILLFAIVLVSLSDVRAQESLFWTDNAYSATGAAVSTPTLILGTEYRIVASTIFWYNYSGGLEADAQYYTTANSSWNWVNNYSSPNGHSFLLIDGSDVNWGSFSNGDTNHTYSITYVGNGRPIIFQVYDWIDQDILNNYCHIEIYIYQGQSAPTPTPSPTQTPTPLPTNSPTPTPIATQSPTPTESPTPTPTSIATSTPSPTSNPTDTPKPAPTTTPTNTPTPTQIGTPISSPTATPTTFTLQASIQNQPISMMTIALLLVLVIYAIDLIIILIILAMLFTEKMKKKRNPV